MREKLHIKGEDMLIDFVIYSWITKFLDDFLQSGKYDDVRGHHCSLKSLRWNGDKKNFRRGIELFKYEDIHYL